MNDLQKAILKLKKEKNTLILAHYYVSVDIQEISDHVGDSFALARLARDTDAGAIMLCGVRFMAESAKILNPSKTVLLPVAEAGCPMADMIRPEDVLRLRGLYPKAAVVCYVNSSAEVKAVSDVCCTSSSAVELVSKLPQKQVIFIPDKNLGAYVAAQLPEKDVILFEGCCPIHDRVKAADIKAARAAHPEAKVLVHPECPPEVVTMADYVGSTAGILDTVIRSKEGEEFIIGTENGVIERLRSLYPEKCVYPLLDDFICPDMKKLSLDDVYRCLQTFETEIVMTAEEIENALISLNRMINA